MASTGDLLTAAHSARHTHLTRCARRSVGNKVTYLMFDTEQRMEEYKARNGDDCVLSEIATA